VDRHEVGNPRRVGSLARGQPAPLEPRPWSGAIPVACARLANRRRGGFDEGRAIPAGKRTLEGRRPRRATLPAGPGDPRGRTLAAEQDPEAGERRGWPSHLEPKMERVLGNVLHFRFWGHRPPRVLQRQEGNGAGDGCRLRERNKALKGEPQERIRHATRPAGSGRNEASGG
jgi:hypothetical protein